MAAKSVVFGPTSKSKANVAKQLAKRNIKVKPVKEGRDLGLDRGAKLTTSRAAHRARKITAGNRFNKAGKKLRLLNAKQIKGI
eukprot:2495922-Pyramimonas_sp.AAC.1